MGTMYRKFTSIMNTSSSSNKKRKLNDYELVEIIRGDSRKNGERIDYYRFQISKEHLWLFDDYEEAASVIDSGLRTMTEQIAHEISGRYFQARLFSGPVDKKDLELLSVSTHAQRIQSRFHRELQSVIDDILIRVLRIFNQYGEDDDTVIRISEVVIAVYHSEVLGSKKIVGYNDYQKDFIFMEDKEYVYIEMQYKKTFSNCIWQAVYIGQNWRKNKGLLTGDELSIQKGGNTLKNDIKKIMLKHGLWKSEWDVGGVRRKDISIFADYFQTVVFLYDSNMKKIQEFKPDKNSLIKSEYFSKIGKKYVIEIQDVGNHARCVINKKHLLYHYPDFQLYSSLEKPLNLMCVVILWKKKKKANIRAAYYQAIKDVNNRIWFRGKIFEKFSDFDLELKRFEQELRQKKGNQFSIEISQNGYITVNKAILPTKDKYEELNYKYACFDIETVLDQNKDKDLKTPKKASGYHTSYAADFCWINKDFKICELDRCFYGLDCLKQLMEFLYKKRKDLNNYIIYSHNGGKFDILLLLREYLLQDDSLWHISMNNMEKMVYSNGRIIKMVLKSKDGCRLEFRDFFCIIGLPLRRICKDFHVETQKGELDYDSINLENYNQIEIRKEVESYIRKDVRGLIEVILKLSKELYTNLNIGINLSKALTAAQMARKIWIKNFYHPDKKLSQKYGKVFPDEKLYAPIYTLTYDEDCFVRKSYFGGRVEARFIGKLPDKKIYMYDVTSEYPFVGRWNLPCGKPRWLNLAEMKKLYGFKDTNNNRFGIKGVGFKLNPELDGHFFGFIECQIKTKDENAIPLTAYQSKIGKLIFPIFKNWTKVTLFSAEIFEGINTGVYEYNFEGGRFLEFCKGKILKQYFDSMFQYKEKASEERNKSLKQIYKIFLNSLYGGFGMHLVREGIEIHPSGAQSLALYMNQAQLIDFKFGELYDIFLVENFLDNVKINVGVASAITSYARIYLWRIITDIEKQGGKVYYFDTDSVITNIDMLENNFLRNKYMRNFGTRLGELKCECSDLLGKKPPYQKSEFFDEGYICGLKMYGLFKNDKNLSKFSCKGFKNDGEFKKEQIQIEGNIMRSNLLCKEVYQHMCAGGIVENTQIQFLCGNSGILKDSQKIWRRDAIKQIKMYYDKGIIQKDGNVKPLII